MQMTPQEEQTLVEVIVQCVRAVLEAYAVDTTRVNPIGYDELHVSKSAPGSRFIDVVAPQEAFKDASMNGNSVGSSNRNRGDVRESLRRFLRNSEPVAAEIKPEPQQMRQLITQAEVLAAYRQGQHAIVLQPGAIVTPLARQIAKDKGVELK
jgi:hypothetical protein